MASAEKVEKLRQALQEFEATGRAGGGAGGFIDREAEEAKAPVRQRALGLLNQRARSRHELAQRLERADFDPQVIAEVLDDLERAHLLDDASFAHEWVRQRHARRGKSRAALNRELAHKGVSQSERDDALEQIDDADEESMAYKIAEKKARSIKAIPGDRHEYDKALRRVVGAIARRGFAESMGFRIAKACVDERLRELVGDDADG